MTTKKTGRRILLTGATGFVGRAAIAPLIASGAELHLVSRREPETLDRAIWHQADLLRSDEVRSLLFDIRPDTLLHLAWCVEHGRFWMDPANLDWVAATANLARAAAEAGTSRFVGAGTCYEYDWPADENCSETHTQLAAHTLYDTCKDATRRMLEVFCAGNGMTFAWARLFFLYGQGEDPRRLVASVARAIVRGETAAISRGLSVRDFMDVRDAGAALSALSLSDLQGAINIASGKGERISELARKIGEVAGRADRVRVGALPDRPGEPPRIVADTRRMREELGFVPAISLEQGLRDVLDFWRRAES
ncbi:NAD-dependent epimerase/dehydratase family protein [Parvibaculum sp.]|uniref:NAD-dependent epimerase/dehydratase family protein n=1 Tax=Parvibaculum sp. TaxID=2024848 RepID=UPI00391D46D8